MKLTILHSTIGVAGALVFGLAMSGNVVGQTATPPAALPPVNPTPALTPSAAPLPPTPTTPVPVPERLDPPTPVPAPKMVFPKPVPANPPIALPGAKFPPAPTPGIPAGDATPAIDPTDKSHEHEEPLISGLRSGSGAPPSAEPFKGEYITREWKVSPELIDDGHGGSRNAKDLLQEKGVIFGAGAMATFKPDSSTLVVRNTPEQINLVENVLFPVRPKEMAGAAGLPGMGDTVSVGGSGEAKPPAGTKRPTVAKIRGFTPNYLPSPSSSPVPIAGMPGGRTAVDDPTSTMSVIKEFPVATIDVGRANLVADLNQDPQASASRYAAIVANFDAQRQAAATAVYGLGEAYRKMGRSAEARVQYARILREFVDFPELARQSQRQLSTTSGSADVEFTGTVGGGNAESAAEEQVLLQEELALLERELTLTQDRIKAGLTPLSEALPLQRDILRLKQQMVRLSRGANRAPSTTPPAAGGSGNYEPAPARRW